MESLLWINLYSDSDLSIQCLKISQKVSFFNATKRIFKVNDKYGVFKQVLDGKHLVKSSNLAKLEF